MPVRGVRVKRDQTEAYPLQNLCSLAWEEPDQCLCLGQPEEEVTANPDEHAANNTPPDFASLIRQLYRLGPRGILLLQRAGDLCNGGGKANN